MLASRFSLLLSLSIGLAMTSSSEAQSLRDAGHILKRVNSPKDPACLNNDCEQNVPAFMKDPANPPIARVSGVPGIQNYSRVVLLGDPKKSPKVKVLYQNEGTIRSATIPSSSVLPRGTRGSSEDELNAFISEAKFQVKLAKSFEYVDSVPKFLEMLNAIETDLACIEKNSNQARRGWNDFVAEVGRSFAPVPGNKPATINKYTKQFFAALNPDKKGRDLANHTLYVPLSMQWVRSFPELEQYFDDKWIHSEVPFDMKIRGGTSGEGVVQNKSSRYNEYEPYLAKLIDLKKAILKMKDPAIRETPEFQWLSKVDESYSDRYDRMIFIHEFTWASKSKGWQDAIPIDQQFSSIEANPILSVLIHETNVNSHSPEFLASDTHSPNDRSTAIWNCLGKTVSLSKANSSPEMKLRAMAIEPQLGSVYLGMIVPKLAQKAGCRP